MGTLKTLFFSFEPNGKLKLFWCPTRILLVSMIFFSAINYIHALYGAFIVTEQDHCLLASLAACSCDHSCMHSDPYQALTYISLLTDNR